MNTQTKHTMSPRGMGMLAGLLAIVGAMSLADVAVAQEQEIVVNGHRSPNRWESGVLTASAANSPIEIKVTTGDFITFRQASFPLDREHGVTFTLDGNQNLVKRCDAQENDTQVLRELALGGGVPDRCGQAAPNGSNLEFKHPGEPALGDRRVIVKLEVIKAFNDPIEFRCFVHDDSLAQGGTMNGVLIFEPPPLPPSIQDFSANPNAIPAEGGSTILSWETQDTTSVAIVANPGGDIGAIPDAEAAAGSREVTPAVNTIYTLTATGPVAPPATQTKEVPVNEGPCVDAGCQYPPCEPCKPCELAHWGPISEMTPAERECWGYAP